LVRTKSESEAVAGTGTGTPPVVVNSGGSVSSGTISAPQFSPPSSSNASPLDVPVAKVEQPVPRRHKIHIQPPQHNNDGTASSAPSGHSASSTFVSVQQLFRTKPCHSFLKREPA